MGEDKRAWELADFDPVTGHVHGCPRNFHLEGMALGAQLRAVIDAPGDCDCASSLYGVAVEMDLEQPGGYEPELAKAVVDAADVLIGERSGEPIPADDPLRERLYQALTKIGDRFDPAPWWKPAPEFDVQVPSDGRTYAVGELVAPVGQLRAVMTQERWSGLLVSIDGGRCEVTIRPQPDPERIEVNIVKALEQVQHEYQLECGHRAVWTPDAKWRGVPLAVPVLGAAYPCGVCSSYPPSPTFGAGGSGGVGAPRSGDFPLGTGPGATRFRAVVRLDDQFRDDDEDLDSAVRNDRRCIDGGYTHERVGLYGDPMPTCVRCRYDGELIANVAVWREQTRSSEPGRPHSPLCARAQDPAHTVTCNCHGMVTAGVGVPYDPQHPPSNPGHGG